MAAGQDCPARSPTLPALLHKPALPPSNGRILYSAADHSLAIFPGFSFIEPGRRRPGIAALLEGGRASSGVSGARFSCPAARFARRRSQTRAPPQKRWPHFPVLIPLTLIPLTLFPLFSPVACSGPPAIFPIWQAKRVQMGGRKRLEISHLQTASLKQARFWPKIEAVLQKNRGPAETILHFFLRFSCFLGFVPL